MIFPTPMAALWPRFMDRSGGSASISIRISTSGSQRNETAEPSPLGLRAGEFIQLVKYAASLANTKIIEFTEVNPKYDIDNRTTKLVAIGIHRFCTGVV